MAPSNNFVWKAFDCINNELLIVKLHVYGFSLESLTFIQSYLSNQIQRVKIISFFIEDSNVESGVPQESISGPLYIFICNLFLDDINANLANYADDTAPHAYGLENEKETTLLAKNIDKLYDWFSGNFLKANPCKCHLLLNTEENVTLKIKMKLLVKVLIKNCLVYYATIYLISMNMSLH